MNSIAALVAEMATGTKPEKPVDGLQVYQSNPFAFGEDHPSLEEAHQRIKTEFTEALAAQSAAEGPHEIVFTDYAHVPSPEVGKPPLLVGRMVVRKIPL